jgi:hypothetical protein
MAHLSPRRAREVLLTSTAWRDYVRGVYSIDPGDHPFLSYVGVNFTSEAIKNYKFYFSFFRRLSAEEIGVLLPVADRGRFDELYDAWHPSQNYGAIHRGTTFALKVETDGTLTHYYHFRVPGLLLGPPERLELQPSDRDRYHGVCEEFTGSSIHLKRYFYCADRATIAESLELAGLTGMADQVPAIDLLEYIESEGRDKMAWITASPLLIGTLIDHRGPPQLEQEIARIRYDCGFQVFGPGSARGGGDHSIYFVHPEGPLHRGGYVFDGVTRFIERHLKLG